MSWDEVRTSAYKNAISTSQNIGSLGNLAINLSLYFMNTKGYTVSTGSIAAIMQGVVEQSNLPPGLSTALLDEPGFKKAKQNPTNDAFPRSAESWVMGAIESAVRAALAIHVQAYERMTQLLYEYIQSYAKQHAQNM